MVELVPLESERRKKKRFDVDEFNDRTIQRK